MKALGSEPWWFWKHHWAKRSTWGKRRLTILIILMMGMFNAIPYTSINHLSNFLQRTAFDPEIAFDTNLAFIPWMFIPYITLYFYYPAAAFLGNKDDNMWRQNIIFHQMMTISCWFVFAVFLLFPVEIDLRGPIQDQLQDGDFGIHSTCSCTRLIPLGIHGLHSMLSRAHKLCSSSAIGIPLILQR